MTHARELQVSNVARANARRVLGAEALSTVIDVPEDWEHFPRARDLFVKGWGNFNVGEAYEACRHEGLPSVARLRAVGYALVGFPQPVSSNESLLSILEEPESPMAQGMWHFKEFWAEHIASLGEVQRHFRSMTGAQYAVEVARNPRFVLQEIWFQRHIERTLVELPSSEAFHWLAGIADVQIGRFTLEVLKDPRRVLEVGVALQLCCAWLEEADVYIDKIRKRMTVLVVLLLDGKPQALGEECFQVYVEKGFDHHFRALLVEKGLFQRFRTNCSLDDWDQLMRDVDSKVIKAIKYNAGVPSWRQLHQRNNKDPSPEFCKIFVDAEPELRRSLLRAWAVEELRVPQPHFTLWALGPEVAIAIASALPENTKVRTLNLSGRSVCDMGANAFAPVLRQNKTLTSLGLAHNDLSVKVALVLADALGRNTSLRRLDLRGNALPSEVAERDERILVE